MRFTKQSLKDGLELLWNYGNKTDFRNDKFRAFVMDSFDDGMAEDCDTLGEFVTLCLRVFRDITEDESLPDKATVIQLFRKDQKCKICDGAGCPECHPEEEK